MSQKILMVLFQDSSTKETLKEMTMEINKDQYLAGLKKYRDRGIAILIDGEALPEQEWNKIFEIREDRYFYMADYVSDEENGRLQEIRFDRVYNH